MLFRLFGFNAVTNNNCLSGGDSHGTHVAGLIGAASNNAIGGSGVMGTNIKLFLSELQQQEAPLILQR